MHFSASSGGYGTKSSIRARFAEEIVPFYRKAQHLESIGRSEEAMRYYASCVFPLIQKWAALAFPRGDMEQAKECAEKSGVDLVGILESEGDSLRRWHMPKEANVLANAYFFEAGIISQEQGQFERAILNYHLSEIASSTAESLAEEQGLSDYLQKVRAKHKIGCFRTFLQYGLDDCVLELEERNSWLAKPLGIINNWNRNRRSKKLFG